MRDIRDDLQDRAGFLKEQISAAQAQFEMQRDRIEQEYDSKLKTLKADLDAVNMLLGVEGRRLGNTPPVPKAQPQPRPQQQTPGREPAQPLPTRPRLPLSEMFRLQRAG